MSKQLDALIDIPCFSCMFWKSDRENHLLCKPAECDELTKWLECLVKILDIETDTQGIEYVSTTTPSLNVIHGHKRTASGKKKK